MSEGLFGLVLRRQILFKKSIMKDPVRHKLFPYPFDSIDRSPHLTAPDTYRRKTGNTPEFLRIADDQRCDLLMQRLKMKIPDDPDNGIMEKGIGPRIKDARRGLQLRADHRLLQPQRRDCLFIEHHR